MNKVRILSSVLLLAFSCHCFAQDENSIEKANQSYSKLLAYIEIAKDKNLPVITRENSMSNIMGQLSISGPAANWRPIKDGLFDVMTDDPEFFFSFILDYPDQLKFFMDNFNLSWAYQGESDYPEKKQLSLKVLKKYIEKETRKLEKAKAFQKVLANTKPSVVD